MQPIEQWLIEHGFFWWFVAVFLLREGITLSKWVLERTLPDRIARRKLAEEQIVINEKRAMDIEERKLELEERKIVSDEQIGKALAIIQNEMNDNKTDHKAIIKSLDRNTVALELLLEMLLRRNDLPGIGEKIEERIGKRILGD